MMDWIALLLALIGGSFTLLHRAMVSKIYSADGKALSTFTLPRIIRREYCARFGRDRLYWMSRLTPALFLVVAIVAWVMAFARIR